MSTLSIVMIVFWAMEAIVLFCLVRSDRRARDKRSLGWHAASSAIILALF